ncbi:MAG: DUF6884 domain-containing protein [Jatrophihabitantaceae bacterium]
MSDADSLRPLVIIPCGAKKASGISPAGQLYLGGYHLACRRLADRLTSPDRILILSARHGLLRLDELIAPYEQRLDQPGAITAGELARQAARLGLRHEAYVVILAGRAYTRLALTIWPAAATPLAGVGSMGNQLRWLAHTARHPDPSSLVGGS